MFICLLESHMLFSFCMLGLGLRRHPRHISGILGRSFEVLNLSRGTWCISYVQNSQIFPPYYLQADSCVASCKSKKMSFIFRQIFVIFTKGWLHRHPGRTDSHNTWKQNPWIFITIGRELWFIVLLATSTTPSRFLDFVRIFQEQKKKKNKRIRRN